MSKEFDDMPDGAGKRATEEDYSRIWRYMQSRNRNPSVRTVLLEITAQNYIPPAVATSARWAKKLGLSSDHSASQVKDAETRQRQRRRNAAPVTVTEVAEATGQEAPKVERTLLTRMRELLKEDNSSTQLAITENRTRMAFNVALMEFYAENPALLANVRDAAAFLDATTIASKLSGGPAIDITLPAPSDDQADGVSPGGHPMKTIGNVDQSLLGKFREFQAQARNGAGT